MQTVIKPLQRAWRFLEGALGGNKYEQYLRHHASCHANHVPLARAEFFKREQERKWSGVARCC